MHPLIKLMLILSMSPVLALVINIAASRTLLPMRPGISRQLICILSVAVGNVPMAIAVWHGAIAELRPDANAVASASLYAIVVYNSLGYAYFHMFNMSETARRVRMLFEIKSAGALTAGEISALYGSDDMLKVRVERLVSLGQIRRADDGRYVLHRRALLHVARMVAFWAGLIGFHFLERFERRQRG